MCLEQRMRNKGPKPMRIIEKFQSIVEKEDSKSFWREKTDHLQKFGDQEDIKLVSNNTATESTNYSI